MPELFRYHFSLVYTAGLIRMYLQNILITLKLPGYSTETILMLPKLFSTFAKPDTIYNTYI
jgi:hypothetical protein